MRLIHFSRSSRVVLHLIPGSTVEVLTLLKKLCSCSMNFHHYEAFLVDILWHCIAVARSVLARPLPKGTVPFGGSNVPFGSATKPIMCPLG